MLTHSLKTVRVRPVVASMYSHATAESGEQLRTLAEATRSSTSRKLSSIRSTVSTENSGMARLLDEYDARAPIRASEEEQWQQLHSSRRNRVRKAAKLGVSVKAMGLGGLDVFYQLLLTTRQRLGLPCAGKAWYRRLIDELDGHLLVAFQGSTPCGSVLVMEDEQNFHYAVPANNARGQATNAMDAIIWELQKSALRQGKLWLCFGGSDPENIGLRRFKNQWGGIERPIYTYTPGAVYARSRLRVARPRLPKAILPILGELYLRFLI